MQACERVGPTELSERILFIDVLRGMALFGILAANMRAFFAPLDIYDNIGVLYHGRADVIVQAFIDALIQGKFISIFSFLFGMGFAIQMSRAEARGARFMSFYPRRLFALALFGVIHGVLIWAGDILLTYALSGGILLLFRKRQQKTLLWWAGSLFAAPMLLGTAFVGAYFSRFHRPWMDPKLPDLKKLYAVIDIYAHGTVRQVMVQNWVEWKHTLPFQLFALYAVALFLLGMWVWRAGIIQRLDNYRPTLKRVCAWCIPVGLAVNVYVAMVKALLPRDGHFSPFRFSAGMLSFAGAHVLSAGYASALALVFLHQDRRRLLLPFAAVGRTALTNYLMQSVLCTLLFYRHPSLYGRVGPALGLVPTVVLFAVQVWFSNWWLNRYRFGPMEWLWRGMTYGSLPPLRKLAPVAAVEDAAPATLTAAAAAASEEAIIGKKE